MTGTRRFVTMAVAFTFAIVAVTGIVFQFFFKTRTLEHIHAWLGLAMTAAAAVHVLQNWRPMSAYLRDARVYALLVPIAVVVGYFAFEPAATNPGPSPRLVVAKLSSAHADDLARAFGKPIESVFAAMAADGLAPADAGETIAHLAERHHLAPDRVLGYFVR